MTPLFRWLVIIVLAYWALDALVAPVEVWDAQTYNLARLLIAKQGGLFGNHGWNSDRQVAFPWSFDAIHYPFLALGAGTSLPSFTCFLGLLFIVFAMVRRFYDSEAAWWACAALLALPTLLFQATSCKNDIPLVFGVACWFYARQFWKDRGGSGFLYLMALALGFTAGAKLSGIQLAAPLALFTLWELRSAWRAAFAFTVALGVSLLLLGSVEIYLNNIAVYGHALGPASLINENRNRDGIAGTIANFIRYSFASMSAGIDAANPQTSFATLLEDGCRRLLTFVGLSNVGYRADYNDSNIQFLKNGWEAGSDYGPVGALGLLVSFYLLLSRRPSSPLWKLAAVGMVTLAMTAATVAWMPWNARFLLLPMTSFTLALALWAYEASLGRPFWRAAFLTLIAFSMVVYPLVSYNRSPRDIVNSVEHRWLEETRERTGMLQIMRDLHSRVKAQRGHVPPLLLCAGGDSWVLCIMELPGVHVIPAPVLNSQTLADFQAKLHADDLLILTLNRPLDPSVSAKVALLANYAETDSKLLEWKQSPATP